VYVLIWIMTPEQPQWTGLQAVVPHSLLQLSSRFKPERYSHSGLLGVFVSMYWLKSMRNCVLLSLWAFRSVQ